MWNKIAVAGGVCAAIIGAGTAALATSGAPSTPGSPPTTGPPANAKHAGKHADRHAGKAELGLRHALHAQWVTQGKDKSFVTHDAIRGTVTAVSATSITVESVDKKSETFVVNTDTKVRIRANDKGAKGAIAQVHTGDKALVVGTGTTTLTAKGILDGGK